MADSVMPSDAPERWLPIPGYEGLYYISDHGRVSTVARQGSAGGLLKLRLNVQGRLMAGLYRNGVGCTRLVHQLVLEAFVGPCPPGMETLHGPGGTLDNRLVNLRWGTKSDNNGPDKVRDGTHVRGERNGQAKLTEADVLEIRRRYTAGETQSAIAETFGLAHGSIGRILQGKRWRHVAGSADKVRDPIRPKGDEHGMAKLTEAAVLTIRQRHAQGDTQTALAREFGVTQGAIWRIVKRRTWTHLP